MPVTLVNPYCTLADLTAELGAGSADADNLSRAINAASRQIDIYTGRRFWVDATVQVRYYRPDTPTCCYVDDIATSTGLIVAVDLIGYGTYDTTLTLNTDFILEPVNAAQELPVRPYEELLIVPFAQNYFPPGKRPGVKVTAKYGWPAIPDDVMKACLLQAAQLFKGKDAPFGVAAFGDVAVLRVKASLNAIAEGLLDPYAKPAVG